MFQTQVDCPKSFYTCSQRPLSTFSPLPAKAGLRLRNDCYCVSLRVSTRVRARVRVFLQFRELVR